MVYIRGRVSKYVINGSKTAVMDVIGFLCVSLGSSTVQLHDSLGSRHVQRLVSVVKMVTVLEEYTTEDQSSVERSLWAKGLNAKDILQETFTVGSVA
jgi:hypothetical protein